MLHYTVSLGGKALRLQPLRVSAAPFNKVWDGTQRAENQAEDAFFVTADITAPAELTITADGDFTDFEIRPASLGLAPVREGRTVRVTVNRPMQFTFEADGTHHALHVFINGESRRPEGDCLYFGPGEHKADLIWLESGQTLYIADGAVVYGVVYAKDAHDIRIMGRGVLDASPYRRGNDDHEGGREIIDALLARGFTMVDQKYAGNLVLNHCHDVTVEGIVLRDAPMWSLITRNDCENITIDNVKIVGQWRYNSDGIDICTSKNVTVRNCFVRSFDDSFVARGAYLEGEEGNVANVTVENCVFWCDWGKSLEIWCGHKPTRISNILFRNCDLIHLCSSAMNIAVWYGSELSVVENVVYEDIRVEADAEYRASMLESEKNPVYQNRPGFLPRLISVSIEKLGRMVDLGSQKIEWATDTSPYHVIYRNIVYDRVSCNGKEPLAVRVQEPGPVLDISGVHFTDCTGMKVC